jgi:hypothetical protein
MEIAWMAAIRDQCEACGVRLYVKQDVASTVMQQNNPGFSGPAGITERNSLGGGPEHVDHDEYDRDA